MDRSLVALVGTGLQVVASGAIGQPPAGSLRNGYDFIEHLLMFGNSGLDDIVVEGAGTIWREWIRSGLPQPVAAEHIAALPELLEAFRAEPSAIAEATASGRRDGSYRLASIIIDKASKAGCFDEKQFSRQLSYFFVERLLAFCLSQSAIVTDLEPAILAYFDRFGEAGAEAAVALFEAEARQRDDAAAWAPGIPAGTATLNVDTAA